MIAHDTVDVPAGRFRVGLEPAEARALARISARVRQQQPADGVGEAVDRERTYGDPGWLERFLLDLFPAHDVDLAAFAIARRPVTNAEYEPFMKATGAPPPRGWDHPRGRDPALPALGVSWEQADAFARWAGARLPTEAEWERTARGRERRLFPWGNDYGVVGEVLEEQEFLRPWIPGAFPSLSTPDGVTDLVTRRWEWCSDRCAPTPGVAAARWQERFGMADPDWRARRGGELTEVVACAVSRGCAEPGGNLVLDTGFRLVYPPQSR